MIVVQNPLNALTIMFRTIDTATRLIDSGIVPIPLYPGTKRPIGEGWQLATMPSVAQLSDLWPDEEGRNIGALMGHSSDNTQGFDFDVYGAWARWRGEYKPPETTTIFTARGIRTIYKTTPDAIQSANIIDNGMRVGELLGNGHQMVMPPSRLANGFAD